MRPPFSIYLDTNVFIAAYESVGARSDHGWWILEAAESGAFQIVTSEITLAELLVRPLSEGNQGLSDIYKAIISDSNVTRAVPVQRDILILSAGLRATRMGLRLPDAVHCATALRSNCRAIVSNDHRFPKELNIEVIPFGPHTTDRLKALCT